MLKKILWPLLCIVCIVMLRPAAFATEAKSTAVVKKYTALFGKTQGKNNWYFCEFGKDKVYELNWDTQNGRWITLSGNGTISSGSIGADNIMGIGYKFVCPAGGEVRLNGSINLPFADSAKGDGCKAAIYHNSKLQWNSDVIYGTNVEYDFSLTTDPGDEIYFVVDCGNNYMYDWIKWIPTVEYTDTLYTGETDYLYYKKQGISRQSLLYDANMGGYVTEDKTALICSNKIKSQSDIKLGKRYIVTEQGRYRVYGYMHPDETEGETILTVLKDGEEIWKQMFPAGEKGIIDVRIFAESGNKIDVEAVNTGCNGDKEISYRCEISKFIGTMFCEAETSDGFSNRTEREYSIEEFIDDGVKNGKAEFYAIKNDLQYDMTYSDSLGRWVSNIPGSNGYISKTGAFPGYDTDTVLELEMSEDGILRIDGDLRVYDYGDGVIAKIYINDRLLWSSRVGGERPVRWDEPYDVSYFLNRVNTVTEVKRGDKLKFTFDQWRKSNLDEIDFSDIKISYISGEVLSDTTKWKLKQSVVADTETGAIYIGGIKDYADVVVENETAYIEKSDATKLIGKESVRPVRVIGGKEYLAVRDILEDDGKTVIWATDRLVIGYDGIPVMFGYSELSELETVLSGDSINEYGELKIVDAKGVETDRFTIGETYYINSVIENYLGNELKIRYITAYYDGSKILRKIVLSDEVVIGTGEAFDTEKLLEYRLPSIVPEADTAEVKVFAWDAENMIKPYLSYTSSKK